MKIVFFIVFFKALREEFRMQPRDVEVAAGEVAVMNCSPPVGHPEPNITWRKDGILINTTDEHYTVRLVLLRGVQRQFFLSYIDNE